MSNKELVKSLEFIRNKAFCTRTFYRAEKEFNRIKEFLTPEESKTLFEALLWVDPEYPDSFTPIRKNDYEYLADTIKSIIKNYN